MAASLRLGLRILLHVFKGISPFSLGSHQSSGFYLGLVIVQG